MTTQERRKRARIKSSREAAEASLFDRRAISPKGLEDRLGLGHFDPAGTLAALTPLEAEAVVRLAHYAAMRLIHT